MMPLVWQQAFLGLLQGLTEFVPISSSGHLAIARAYLGMDPERNLATVAILHLGTLVSLTFCRGKDLMEVVVSKSPFRNIEFHALLVTSLTTGLIYAGFRSFFDDAFSTPRIAGVGLVFTAFLLVYAELRKAKAPRHLRHTRFFDWIMLGVLQAFAILPGVSRSGATIAGGLLVGLDRKESVRFAFLLAFPPIVMGAILHGNEILSFIKSNPLPSAVGFLVSLVTGIFAIKFMFQFVPKRRLEPFALYCLILGIVAALSR